MTYIGFRVFNGDHFLCSLVFSDTLQKRMIFKFQLDLVKFYPMNSSIKL